LIVADRQGRFAQNAEEKEELNPPFYSFVISTKDADEASESISSAFAPIRIRPAHGGHFDMSFRSHVIGGLMVSTIRSSSGADGHWDRPFDGYNFSMPATGWWQGLVGGNAIRSTDATGVMLDAARVTRSTTSADLDAELLTVDSDTLHSSLSALLDAPVLRRVDFAPQVAVSSAAALMARALCGAVRSGLSADSPLGFSSGTVISMREALLNLLLELLPHSYSDALRRPAAMPSPRHVRRAIEFIHQRAAQPMTVADIAAAANTSVRSLQAGFLRFKSVSPVAYLRQVRLAGARADLIAAEASTTVAQVAKLWGFANPGAFAALYRDAFGELPSATLKFGSQGRS